MRGGLPVLTYHALDGSGAITATAPTWFAATMAALHAAGWRAVDLSEWVAAGRPEVPQGFAVAFDDGLRSIRRAADVLARFDFPATAFLVSGRMGGDNGWRGQPRSIPRSRILDWSELAELRAAGFRFGAHTRTHPRLDRLGLVALHEELRGSRQEIEDRTGEPCPLLAYPYGIASKRVRRVARQHFDAAFGTDLDYASAEDDPYFISRVDAHYLRSRRDLDALLNGKWRGALAVLRVVRGVKRAGQTLIDGVGRLPHLGAAKRPGFLRRRGPGRRSPRRGSPGTPPGGPAPPADDPPDWRPDTRQGPRPHDPGRGRLDEEPRFP